MSSIKRRKIADGDRVVDSKSNEAISSSVSGFPEPENKAVVGQENENGGDDTKTFKDLVCICPRTCVDIPLRIIRASLIRYVTHVRLWDTKLLRLYKQNRYH